MADGSPRWQEFSRRGARYARRLLRALLPVEALAPDPPCDADASGSLGPGAAWASGGPLALAEALVREAAREKLRALGVGDEQGERLVANPPHVRYRWPTLGGPAAPLAAGLRRLYGQAYVVALHARLLRLDDVPDALRHDPAWRDLPARAAEVQAGVENALAPLLAEATTDSAGEQFLGGLRDWVRALAQDARAAVGERLDGPRPRASVRDTLRVFVATDREQALAERVLEYGLRTHATGPVHLTWMDPARRGPWHGWAAGSKAPTSTLRFSVPELAGFEGRALYLDVDMLVLRDPHELLRVPQHRPWLSTPACPAAAVIDCASFRDRPWWPRADEMRRSGADLGHYVGLLDEHGMRGSVSNRWNCHDGACYEPGYTAIVHFTRARSQPWRPRPGIDYEPHPVRELEALWWQTYLECQGTWYRGHDRHRPSPRYETLLDAYREMHSECGDELLGLPARAVFRGETTLHHAHELRRVVARHGARRLLDYGCGKGRQYTTRLDRLEDLGLRRVKAPFPADVPHESLGAYWGVDEVVAYDPGAGLLPALEPAGYDGVLCIDVLEHCAELDLPWIVRELFSLARAFLYVSVSTRSSRRTLPTGENAHEVRRPPGFWLALLRTAAADHPEVECHLVCDGLAVPWRPRAGGELEP